MRLQGDYESFLVSSEELWQVCWIRGIDGSDVLDTSRGIGGKDSTGDRERQGGGGREGGGCWGLQLSHTPLRSQPPTVCQSGGGGAPSCHARCARATWMSPRRCNAPGWRGAKPDVRRVRTLYRRAEFTVPCIVSASSAHGSAGLRELRTQLQSTAQLHAINAMI